MSIIIAPKQKAPIAIITYKKQIGCQIELDRLSSINRGSGKAGIPETNQVFCRCSPEQEPSNMQFAFIVVCVAALSNGALAYDSKLHIAQLKAEKTSF